MKFDLVHKRDILSKHVHLIIDHLLQVVFLFRVHVCMGVGNFVRLYWMRDTPH